MMKMAISVAVLLLAVTAARGQTTRTTPSTCGCSSGPIIDADGNLDPAHCNARHVLEALDRYAVRSARLLPERAEPVDIETGQRKLEQLRRDVVGELLEWMTREDLDRFLPVLSPDPPPPGSDARRASWPGAHLVDCENGAYWINAALDAMADVDATLLQLYLETEMYFNDPALFCNPQLLANSVTYLTATGHYHETRAWLQSAADSMSAGNAGLAAVQVFLGWWRAFQTGLGFIVAYNSPTLSGDDRCTEVGSIGLGMAPVSQAAHQAYERITLCAQNL